MSYITIFTIYTANILRKVEAKMTTIFFYQRVGL